MCVGGGERVASFLEQEKWGRARMGRRMMSSVCGMLGLKVHETYKQMASRWLDT